MISTSRRGRVFVALIYHDEGTLERTEDAKPNKLIPTSIVKRQGVSSIPEIEQV